MHRNCARKPASTRFTACAASSRHRVWSRGDQNGFDSLYVNPQSVGYTWRLHQMQHHLMLYLMLLFWSPADANHRDP